MTAPMTREELPELPDDDSDFTPDLARKIIAKYQELLRGVAQQPPSEPNLENLADRFVSIIQDGRAQEAGSKSIASMIINELLMLRVISVGSPIPSTLQAPIDGTESCTCHFMGAGTHHISGCPYYTVMTSKDQGDK